MRIIHLSLLFCAAVMGFGNFAVGQTTQPQPTAKSTTRQTPPSAHDFAQSNNRNFSISPDGKKIAFIQGEEAEAHVTLVNLETEETGTIGIGNDLKPKDLIWLKNDILSIRVSVAGYGRRQLFGPEEAWELSREFLFAVSTGTLRETVIEESQIHGLHILPNIRFSGNDEDNKVLVVGFISIWEIDLSTFESKIAESGMRLTDYIYLDSTGHARVRFDSQQISQHVGDKRFNGWYSVKEGQNWRKILEFRNVEELPIVFGGMTDSNNALVLDVSGEETEIKNLNLTNGALSLAFPEETRNVKSLITDPYTLAPIGIEFDSYAPQTRWLNSEMARAQAKLETAFPNANVQIRDWSRDKSKFIVTVATGSAPDKTYYFDTTTLRAEILWDTPESFTTFEFGNKSLLSFQSRDGQNIPTFVTFPANRQRRNLPTIVLPHGGPESQDYANYDYISQFLASRGYLVIQPQFRGSTGNGTAFAKAGYGEWGGKMQNDVTDSLKWAIDQGWADSSRVCIVGASYGGYAALAGVTMTPDLFKCAISYGGVFDLGAMQLREEETRGIGSETVAYWRESMGLTRKDRVAIRNISPQYLTNNISAPVLLIHGKDDTVVPITQSINMANALRRANKNYQFIELEGEDHWLSRASTRERFLTEMERFLAPILRPEQ